MIPRTVVRFLAVGVCNTLIDLVLFWVLHASMGIVLANFVSTSAGMTFSFLVNGRHTFGAERVTLRQAVLFVAANGATMWVLQPVLIHAVHDVASVPLMLAKVVALGGSVVANFLLYRYVVWPVRPAGRACEAVTAQRGRRARRASPTSVGSRQARPTVTRRADLVPSRGPDAVGRTFDQRSQGVGPTAG